MSLIDAAVSAFLQAAVLGGVPLLGYIIYQKLRHKRALEESIRRAGLQLGKPRYLVYSLAFALLGICLIVLIFVIWSPSLEPFTRKGAAQRPFVGLGFSMSAIVLALLNGGVQTGFAEELLFRGLIAGSLSRRLPIVWANVFQAFIFLVPHFLILLVMPEMWPILPLVFLGALIFGWVRIKSGSILGSWLMHASGNITMALIVAIRTSV
jgi:membrane protease YdiL (CAAX protease family)